MNTETLTDNLISASEIAPMLGLTRTSVLGMIKSGVFGPWVDVSRGDATRAQPRIRQSQLDAFLVARTRANPQIPSAPVDGQLELDFG